ncbi:protein of unknown function [Streptomyces murinus]
MTEKMPKGCNGSYPGSFLATNYLVFTVPW